MVLEVAHQSILLQLDLDTPQSSQELRNNNIDQYLEVLQQIQNLYKKGETESEREREGGREEEERRGENTKLKCAVHKKGTSI